MDIGTPLRLACATDDGTTFTKKHFGSAKKYLIYQWNTENKKFDLITTEMNTSIEERMHADPLKAQNVGEILNHHKVQVMVAKVIGENIVKMQKRFVPIISRDPLISSTLEKLIQHISEMEREAKKEKGETRKVIMVQ